jgi:hypothetical protein
VYRGGVIRAASIRDIGAASLGILGRTKSHRAARRSQAEGDRVSIFSSSF